MGTRPAARTFSTTATRSFRNATGSQSFDPKPMAMTFASGLSARTSSIRCTASRWWRLP
jgi:hypothetical protein